LVLCCDRDHKKESTSVAAISSPALAYDNSQHITHRPPPTQAHIDIRANCVAQHPTCCSVPSLSELLISNSAAVKLARHGEEQAQTGGGAREIGEGSASGGLH